MSAGLRAIRSSAALSRQGETAVVRVTGEHAWDLLDRELTCDLYLRDGQARSALLLHEDGRVQADVTVLCADETFWLLVDGAPGAGVSARLTAARGADEDVTVSVEEGLTVVGLDGPFAWEVLAALEGRGVIGLPLMSFFTMDRGPLCLRDGRHGEFGYRFVLTASEADDLLRALSEGANSVGVPLGLATARDRATCMLENHVFCVGREGRSDLDAGELQLGWRLSADKDAPGLAAARRGAAAGRRTVTFRADEDLADTVVQLGDVVVGSVLAWERCSHGPGIVGLAALTRELAHPGIGALSAGDVSLRTVSPPLIANRSLYVNPQHHRYVDRDAIGLP